MVEALVAASPGRLLAALARGPGDPGASSSRPTKADLLLGDAPPSPSRPAWADLAGEGLPPAQVFFDGSPGLLREVLDRGPGERVALSDSEDLSESVSEVERGTLPPDGKGN